MWMRKSESERPMSISLLHFKWPKNISFRSESTVFWSGLFECFRLFRFESSTHHTLYAGSLCCCCYCWFVFFSSVRSFRFAFFGSRFCFIWFLPFCCLSVHIIHMYYDYYCFCCFFGWTSKIITFNLNCILPHQRKHNFCLKRHTIFGRLSILERIGILSIILCVCVISYISPSKIVAFVRDLNW